MLKKEHIEYVYHTDWKSSTYIQELILSRSEIILVV